MSRTLRVIMALLMIIAVYCTFRFRLVSSSVSNTTDAPVIVIDPGHGGDDPGKIGINGALEKDINLAISMKLKECLEKAGYRVVVTRPDDAGLYERDAKNKKMSDMKQRCRIIEEANASMVISIHQNSFSKESVRGAQVFYYKYSTEGKRLAEAIQQMLREQLDSENNRVVKDNSSYYMLLHTPCPTVIVECGFLSNQEEADKLITDSYQENVAKAICAGVKAYLVDEK